MTAMVASRSIEPAHTDIVVAGGRIHSQGIAHSDDGAGVQSNEALGIGEVTR